MSGSVQRADDAENSVGTVWERTLLSRNLNLEFPTVGEPYGCVKSISVFAERVTFFER